MTVFYEGGGVTVLHGDCVAELAGLPDGSVDAVVTDPPYGLEFMGKEWDAPWKADGTVLHDPAEVGGFQDGAGGNPYSRSRVRFGIGPDFQSWCETWAAECLRVLKPGGHLLAFGGTRTAHRLTCAIEDAGFEIRDSIAWLYGSGFPKSLDVSKAIDKAAGAEREVVGTRTDVATRIYDGGDGPRLPDSINVTAPATDAARTWQGWGTALKPAHEPITVARKPLSGTVAATVLQHGTGALNIDGCRVGPDPGYSYPNGPGGCAGDFHYQDRATTPAASNPAGRWPANVVLDEDAAAHLDQQSGQTISGVMRAGTRPIGERTTYGQDAAGGYETTRDTPGDAGGASRFFYTAKAGSGERVRLPKDGAGEGRVIDGTVKRCRVCGCKTIRPPNPSPSCGHNDYERVPTAARPEHVAHPTVKPLALMRWLVRLVTPPGGTVLDPFAGSGTTAEAALLEGFACITVEREDEYLPLIVQRLNRRRDPEAYLRAAGVDDLGLFALDDDGNEAR